jgi:hypothetical protein
LAGAWPRDEPEDVVDLLDGEARGDGVEGARECCPAQDRPPRANGGAVGAEGCHVEHAAQSDVAADEQRVGATGGSEFDRQNAVIHGQVAVEYRHRDAFDANFEPAPLVDDVTVDLVGGEDAAGELEVSCWRDEKGRRRKLATD